MDDTDITALRQRAEHVLERLNKEKRKHPLFVEFSGTPKSGKSTCIDIVSHFFRRLGFRVLAPTEGASKRTPYYLKEDLVAFNTWSACYALMHVFEGIYHSDRYDIALLDRGLFDALVWFELLVTDEKITREECEQVHNFLLIDRWRSVIDLVFLFKVDIDTSLTRENRNTLIPDVGRAMNPTFLRTLNNAYDQTLDRYRAKFPNLEIVNSNDAVSTPQTTAFHITNSIINVFERERS